MIHYFYIHVTNIKIYYCLKVNRPVHGRYFSYYCLPRHLFAFPPPPAIINNEFISPDDPRLPKLEADIDGNPPVPEHFCWFPPPNSGAPPAEDCAGGASNFLRICSSSRACMSIWNRVIQQWLIFERSCDKFIFYLHLYLINCYIIQSK